MSANQATHRRRVLYWHRWLTARSASRLATWYSYLTRQADCILVTAEK
jgi:hypothetical protein